MRTLSVNNFEKNSISFQNLKNLDFVTLVKNSDFCSTFRKSQFRSTFSKKMPFRFKHSKILISVNIFQNISISVQNFENLDFGQQFRKNFDFVSKFWKSRFRSIFPKKFRFPKFRKSRFRSTFSIKFLFRFKIRKISNSVNIFEKISILVQNFENLDFDQHLRKNFDFCWTFWKSRFRSTFLENSNSVQNFENSIPVKVFEKNSISFENFEDLDSGRLLRKKSISVQNFENLVLGQHLRKKFDLD